MAVHRVGVPQYMWDSLIMPVGMVYPHYDIDKSETINILTMLYVGGDEVLICSEADVGSSFQVYGAVSAAPAPRIDELEEVFHRKLDERFNYQTNMDVVQNADILKMQQLMEEIKDHVMDTNVPVDNVCVDHHIDALKYGIGAYEDDRIEDLYPRRVMGRFTTEAQEETVYETADDKYIYKLTKRLGDEDERRKHNDNSRASKRRAKERASGSSEREAENTILKTS